MRVSYSEIQTFQRCPKKYEFASVQKLQRKVVALPLAKGIIIHQLMQGFYLDGHIETMLDTLIGEFAAHPYTIDVDTVTFEEVLDESELLVRAYLRHYLDDQEWEVLHVEEQFTVELTGHEITFTPDLIVRDGNGQVWIVDHKSTAQLPGPGMPFGDLQSLLYISAVQQVYPELAGFIFNYLRKKTPSVPRMTKTKPYRIAYLKTIDTTYEVLRDWIQDHAPEELDKPEVKIRLAELRERDKFFAREYVLISDIMQEGILSEVIATVEEMERAHLADESGQVDVAFRRVFGNKLWGVMSCEKCSYLSVCQGELLGWDTQRIILEQYEPRDLSHKDYEVDTDET